MKWGLGPDGYLSSYAAFCYFPNFPCLVQLFVHRGVWCVKVVQWAVKSSRPCTYHLLRAIQLQQLLWSPLELLYGQMGKYGSL